MGRRRGNAGRLPVHLLCAWEPDYAAETLAPLVPSIEDDCQALLDRAAAQARAVSPRLDIHGSTVHAQPASALIAASRDADTVIVGSRGLGSVKEALAGSTSMQVASHASCPVVVVREVVAGRDADRRIVVGADGSALSTEATGYAFKQASQRGRQRSGRSARGIRSLKISLVALLVTAVLQGVGVVITAVIGLGPAEVDSKRDKRIRMTPPHARPERSPRDSCSCMSPSSSRAHVRADQDGRDRPCGARWRQRRLRRGGQCLS